jgi:phage tail sheath protein FI
MAQYRRPGVFVNDVTPLPVPPATNPAALGIVGYTLKGPSNRAVIVQSMQDFVDHFGTFTQLSLVPLEVEKFFNNGGQTAYVVRVTPVGSEVADGFFDGTAVVGQNIGTGDGIASRFVGVIADAPIVKGSVVITTTLIGPTAVTVIDDGYGHLINNPPSLNGIATIGVNYVNYQTGEFDVTFGVANVATAVVLATPILVSFTRSRWEFNAQSEGAWGNNIKVDIEGSANFRKQRRYGDFTPAFLAVGNGTAGPYTFIIPNAPLTPDTVEITAGDQMAYDDGANNLLGDCLVSSSVNYVTGEVSITFTAVVPTPIPIRASVHGFEFWDALISEYQTDTEEFLVQEVFEALDMVDTDSPDYLTRVINDEQQGSSFVMAVAGEAGKLPELIRNVFKQTIGVGDGTTRRFTFTLPNVPVDPFSLVVNSMLPFEEALDDGVGFFFGPNVDPFGVNQVDYTLGTVDVTFKLAPAVAQNVVCIYAQQRVITGIQLERGTDGTGVITRSQIAVSGLEPGNDGVFAFNAVETALNVIVPDFASNALVLRDLIAFAEAKKDRFIIGTTDVNLTPTQAVNFRRNDILSTSSFCAVYYPWVKSLDRSINKVRTIPPLGHVAGVYARTDLTRSEGKAPAGIIDGQLLDIVGLERILEPNDQELIFPTHLNSILQAAGIGIYVNGARTLSTDLNFKYVNVRRVFIAIRKQAENSLRFALFEPIGPALFSRIKAALTQIALGFFQKGALAGSNPQQAFIVTVDELNTPALADQGIVKASLAIAPTKPAEFIVVELSILQQQSTITTV